MATVDNRLPTEGTQLDIVAGLATIASALTPSNTEGHVIENDSGTELAQQDNLQFKGTYTANQTGKTVVNVTRSMTLAEYNLLSADEKKGIIEITDENGYEIKPTDIDSLYAETVYPVEESPSTHAYAQGDHLIWEGYTYIAKTAIAIGDSLVLNTNVELETLATRMNHIEQGIYDVDNKTWTYVGAISNGSQGVDISAYKEIYIQPKVGGSRYNSYLFTINTVNSAYISVVESESTRFYGRFSVSNGILTFTLGTNAGWSAGSISIDVYGK